MTSIVSKMKVGIIGIGGVGSGIGILCAKGKHQVTFGVRDPNTDKVKEALKETPEATASSVAEAIANNDVIVIATPWNAVKTVIEENKWDGKVIIDAINPIGPGFS
jgi:predicted dinucleotide-binding enzyme